MADLSVRRRLAPEARREELLDHAARLVLAEGLSAVSMERLAREAGASRALAYAYFPTREALLRALLLREHQAFRVRGKRLLADARGFEDSVRATTAAWIDHVRERGALIERLAGEPGIASALAGVEEEGRAFTVNWFGEAVAKAYGVPLGRARLAAELLMGLTGAAGHAASRGADRDEVVALCIDMIFAGLEAARG